MNRVLRNLLCVTIATVCLWGQASTGEIRIEVKDPSGAPMDASGQLKSVATGAERAFRTDPQGAWTFEEVPSGAYRLTVLRDGFATQTLPVDVKSGRPILRTVKMALGHAPQSQVDVVDTMPLPGVDLSTN